MAAFAIIHVAGFAGIEVVGGIVVDFGVNIAMLEVGGGVTGFAAGVIGGGDIINAGAGF